MALLNHAMADDFSPRPSYDALPNGDYPVIISDSEMKETKAGNGHYLELTLEVIEGDHQGRRVWDRLNLDNPNAKAVEIAQRTLDSILFALGMNSVEDSAELHDKPLIARVRIRKDDPTQNEVKGYIGYANAADAPAPKPAVAAVPTPKKPNGGTPPWAKK